MKQCLRIKLNFVIEVEQSHRGIGKIGDYNLTTVLVQSLLNLGALTGEVYLFGGGSRSLAVVPRPKEKAAAPSAPKQTAPASRKRSGKAGRHA